MKNKLKLLTSIATLLVASSVIAEDGSIDLSLTVGGGSGANTVTLGGSLHDNPTAPELSFDNNTGKIILNPAGIGNLKLTGSDIASGYQCSLKFESTYLSASGAFELREAGYTDSNPDAIPYYILLTGTATTPTGTANINPVTPTNGQEIIAKANADNECIIDITKMQIGHSGSALSGKSGNYSGTLTYTLTFDAIGTTG